MGLLNFTVNYGKYRNFTSVLYNEVVAVIYNNIINIADIVIV